jgi:hypothetical protein
MNSEPSARYPAHIEGSSTRSYNTCDAGTERRTLLNFAQNSIATNILGVNVPR